MRSTRLRPSRSPRSPHPARSLRGLGALAAASALLLSGCGVAGTDFHPGVAASVGDRTVTTDRVDSLVTSYCAAVSEQLAGSDQVVPLSYFRSGVAGQLALRSAAEQLAADYSVGTSDDYRTKVDQLTTAVAQLPADQQEAVLAIESSADYISDIELAVGAKQLRDRGTSDPDDAEATTLGTQTFTTWLDDHDLEIDPRYAVEIKDGAAVPTDTSLSFAVSSAAEEGAKDSPDQAYAAALPSSQRCG